jgi:hypothetical protein
MLDAFGVLYTEFSENILADKILKSDNLNPTLVLRLLTHIVGKDSPPKYYLEKIFVINGKLLHTQHTHILWFIEKSYIFIGCPAGYIRLWIWMEQ